MLGKQTKLLSVVSRRSLGDLVHFRPSLQRCNFTTSLGCCRHSKSNKDGKGKKKQLSSIVQAVTVKPLVDPDGINVGEELSGSLDREAVLKLLNKFYQRGEIKSLSAEHGLDLKLFHQAFMAFRRYCVETKLLPVDLHVILSDILQSAGHVDDIFPFFIRFAKQMFPHLECMEDLQKISDLRQPANWYPEARAIQRKIIYHAGPTNSGKTYHALDRFFSAKSGVYCGPLRLLANEVFKKSNTAGTPCDLVTGEERRLVSVTGDPANHVACTVEMTSVTSPYEVAVVDEIQMIRDHQRGWAWTRAFLGLNAQEVHVCGDDSAVPLLRELALSVGNEFEVRRYKRLTPLTVLSKGLDTFSRVQRGDAIVCFSKNDIYHVSRQLEKNGIEAAVIYGTLPPGTKIAQAQKFNDPASTCKVLVSTDAIGMGLNLNIKRVVFYSLMKPVINEKGEKEMDVISPSTALQIAGRAGRFNTEFANGEVTTFRSNDLPLLKKLMETPLEEIERAGLHPTAEQIELFAYHLPKASLSNLIDVFVTVSTLDNDKFFMCHVDEFKFLADMIEHVPLPLRMRYVFCCAPIPKKQPFVCTMFLKFARRVSRNEPVTLDWLCTQLGWPFNTPCKIADLTHLESVFDVLDNYLWLGYRFPDMFPDMSHVRDLQKELDELIQKGIFNITQLLHNAETSISSGTPDTEDDYEVKWRSRVSETGLQGQGRRKGRLPPADDDVDAKELIKSLKNMSTPASSVDLGPPRDSAFDSRLHQRSPVSLHSKQRLVDQLLEQGIISKDMLAKLQQELTDKQKSDE